MQWHKLGRVFAPDRQFPWMVSHAANPVPELLGGDRVRIYFSCRDTANRSSIGYVEIDLKAPQEILALSDQPVLGPGERGSFDDSGTTICCLTAIGGDHYLYYLGWNLSTTVPWRNSLGLAIRRAGSDRFVKVSPAPILDRNAVDPYSLSYGWVLPEGDRYRLWYGSNLRWGQGWDQMYYVIKYAESTDGIDWQRQGIVALGFQSPEEYALARPCVLKTEQGYQMWYSHRGDHYRIGYAESRDGLHWQRLDDQAGIEPSATGWDAPMIEYPCVFDHGGQRYLLYNGDRFGKTGFGLAVLAP